MLFKYATPEFPYLKSNDSVSSCIIPKKTNNIRMWVETLKVLVIVEFIDLFHSTVKFIRAAAQGVVQSCCFLPHI